MREWLVNMRHKCGISQYKAADLAGISQSYYAAIETGARQSDMSLSTMQKLAAAFGVSVSDIVNAETEYQAKRVNQIGERNGANTEQGDCKR